MNFPENYLKNGLIEKLCWFTVISANLLIQFVTYASFFVYCCLNFGLYIVLYDNDDHQTKSIRVHKLDEVVVGYFTTIIINVRFLFICIYIKVTYQQLPTVDI